MAKWTISFLSYGLKDFSYIKSRRNKDAIRTITRFRIRIIQKKKKKEEVLVIQFDIVER